MGREGSLLWGRHSVSLWYAEYTLPGWIPSHVGNDKVSLREAEEFNRSLAALGMTFGGGEW